MTELVHGYLLTSFSHFLSSNARSNPNITATNGPSFTFNHDQTLYTSLPGTTNSAITA